jgi:hypothetical protein
MAESPVEQPAPDHEGADDSLDEAPPRAAEARGWRGWRIDDVDGKRVGSVEAVYVDAATGEGAWLLARLGRLRRRRTALPLGDSVGAAGGVWVPYERALIRAAPAVEPGAELSRELELALCTHFGIPDGSGRAAVVAAMPAGTLSARIEP